MELRGSEGWDRVRRFRSDVAWKGEWLAWRSGRDCEKP